MPLIGKYLDTWFDNKDIMKRNILLSQDYLSITLFLPKIP